ncbi:MAG: hypothetical protein ACR2MX_20095, partial [Cyclobacteriaceae bacterium]
MKRILGAIENDHSDTLIILIGGVHGNEAAGVKAILEIFHQINIHRIQVNATLVGIAGNLQALAKNARYIDYDLNRCWENGRLNYLPESHHTKAEDVELQALWQAIEKYNTDSYKTKVLVDLHATSADTGNFIVIPEDEAHNPVVKSLKQPVVIDLDKYLKGTLLKFMHDRGFLSFAFEGGMIGSPEAVQLHVAGIWELLNAAGVVESSPDSLLGYKEILDSFSDGLPSHIKVLYHHWIEDEDHFEMLPGYNNFQPVNEGEVLAYDKRGEVTAPMK